MIIIIIQISKDSDEENKPMNTINYICKGVAISIWLHNKSREVWKTCSNAYEDELKQVNETLHRNRSGKAIAKQMTALKIVQQTNGEERLTTATKLSQALDRMVAPPRERRQGSGIQQSSRGHGSLQRDKFTAPRVKTRSKAQGKTGWLRRDSNVFEGTALTQAWLERIWGNRFDSGVTRTHLWTCSVVRLALLLHGFTPLWEEIRLCRVSIINLQAMYVAWSSH